MERADNNLPAKDAQEHKQTPAEEATSSNCLVDLAKSAANSAVGDPVRAVAQIIDHSAGTTLDTKVKAGLASLGIEAPKAAQYGTTNWYAQQLGNGIGMMVPYMLARKGVGSLTGKAFGETAALKTSLSAGIFSQDMLKAAGHEAALSGATGFLYGSFLRTSNEQNVGSSSFLSDRLHNGTSDATTFALLGFTNPYMGKALGAAAGAIEQPLSTNAAGAITQPLIKAIEQPIAKEAGAGLLPETKLASWSLLGTEKPIFSVLQDTIIPGAQKTLAAALRGPVLPGMLSGIPGGTLNAETGAWKDGRWLATGQELKENIVGMAFVGGAFGSAHRLMSLGPAVKNSDSKQPQDTVGTAATEPESKDVPNRQEIQQADQGKKTEDIALHSEGLLAGAKVFTAEQVGPNFADLVKESSAKGKDEIWNDNLQVPPAIEQRFSDLHKLDQALIAGAFYMVRANAQPFGNSYSKAEPLPSHSILQLDGKALVDAFAFVDRSQITSDAIRSHKTDNRDSLRDDAFRLKLWNESPLPIRKERWIPNSQMPAADAATLVRAHSALTPEVEQRRQEQRIMPEPDVIRSGRMAARDTATRAYKLASTFGDKWRDFADAMGWKQAESKAVWSQEQPEFYRWIDKMLPIKPPVEARKWGDWLLKYATDGKNADGTVNVEGTVTAEGARRAGKHWFQLDDSIHELPLEQFMTQIGTLERDLLAQYADQAGSDLHSPAAYAAINLGRGQLERGELITAERALSRQNLIKAGNRLTTSQGTEVAMPTVEQLQRAIKAWEVDPSIPLELACQPLAPWQISALSLAMKEVSPREFYADKDRQSNVDLLKSRYDANTQKGRDEILSQANLQHLVAAKEAHPALSEFNQYLIAATAEEWLSKPAADFVSKMNGQHFVDILASLDKDPKEENRVLSYAQAAYEQRLPLDLYFKNMKQSEASMDMKSNTELALKLSVVFKNASSDTCIDWLNSIRKHVWKKAREESDIGSVLAVSRTAADLNKALELDSADDLAGLHSWLVNNPQRTEEISTTIGATIQKYLSRGRSEPVNKLVELGLVTQEDLRNPGIRAAAQSGLRKHLAKPWIDHTAKYISDANRLFSLDSTEDIVRPTAAASLATWLSNGWLDSVSRCLKQNILSEADLDTPEIHSAAAARLAIFLSEADMHGAQTLLDSKLLTKEDLQADEIRKAAYSGILMSLAWGKSWEYRQLTQLNLVPAADLNIEEMRDTARTGVMKHLSHDDINAAIKLIDIKLLDQDALDKCFRQAAADGHITTVLRTALADRLGQNLVFNSALANCLGITKLTDANAAELVEDLKKRDKNWKDKDNVVGPFEEGAKVFGAARMLRYVIKSNVSPHDALLSFSHALELYRKSELTPEQFYGNILAQVHRDDAADDTGTSFFRLGAIARAFPESIPPLLDKARSYSEVPTLQKLAASFPSAQSVFASWAHLQRFAKLQKFVEHSELLPQLQQLRLDNHVKLADWVEALAFHPDSRVSTQSVLDFWRAPEEFLSHSEVHAAQAHELKKPSHYTNIPHLDLTARELRDALIDGTLDRLQVFSPMKVEYEVGGTPLNLAADLRRALGSRSENRLGEAKNIGKLYSEARKILQPSNLTVSQALSGLELPAELQDQLAAVLYDNEIGITQPQTGLRLIAEIHKKSDPQGAVSGDDSTSCMPFGSGKNNIYTFNPNNTAMTVRLVRNDGTSRTIAQSVLTKDRDVKVLVPTILAKMQADNAAALHTIFPEEALRADKAYPAADNVQAHPNYQSGAYPPALKAVYLDAFARYTKLHAAEENLQSDKLVIGTGYSNTMTSLPTEPNTFVPQAPPGYSDKTQETVYSLSLSQPPEIPIRVIGEEHAQIANRVNQNAPASFGIAPLTFQDTLPVAWLEDKVYQDNASLRQGLHNMENALIAKDINNAAKERPNLSLKYTDGEGRMKGYLLAYEGRANYEGKTEPIIFISDLASDRRTNSDGASVPSVAGGKLLLQFAELYKQHYLDQGKMTPIFTNAREETSYKLMMRQLELLGEKSGYSFEVKEIGNHQADSSTMHDVLIVPHQISS